MWARSGSRIRKKEFATQPPRPKDISFRSGHCGFTCSWRSKHTQKKLCTYVAAHETNMLGGTSLLGATQKVPQQRQRATQITLIQLCPSHGPFPNSHCHLRRRKDIEKGTHAQFSHFVFEGNCLKARTLQNLCNFSFPIPSLFLSRFPGNTCCRDVTAKLQAALSVTCTNEHLQRLGVL